MPQRHTGRGGRRRKRWESHVEGAAEGRRDAAAVAAEAFAVAAEGTYCLDPTWHWWGRNEEGVARHKTPRGIPWTRAPLRLRRRCHPRHCCIALRCDYPSPKFLRPKMRHLIHNLMDYWNHHCFDLFVVVVAAAAGNVAAFADAFVVVVVAVDAEIAESFAVVAENWYYEIVVAAYDD